MAQVPKCLHACKKLNKEKKLGWDSQNLLRPFINCGAWGCVIVTEVIMVQVGICQLRPLL